MCGGFKSLLRGLRGMRGVFLKTQSHRLHYFANFEVILRNLEENLENIVRVFQKSSPHPRIPAV